MDQKIENLVEVNLESVKSAIHLDEILESVECNKEAVNGIGKAVIDAEASIENLERLGRLNNLIIDGIPVNKNENLIQLINNLCTFLDVEIYAGEISSIFRLPFKKNTIPSILVKFTTKIGRDRMYSSYFKVKKNMKKFLSLNDIGYGPSTGRVYISEQLTQKNASLIKKARQLKMDKKFFNTYSFNGNVYIVIEETGQPKLISNLEDLDKFT